MRLKTINCTRCGATDTYDSSWFCQTCKKELMEDVNNESQRKRKAEDNLAFGRKPKTF